MLNTEVIQNFILSIRQITKAETVSLLIKSTHSSQPDVVLLHSGQQNPVAEFVSTDKALIAITKLNSRTNQQESLNSVPVALWKSTHDKGYLLRINLALYLQGLENNKYPADQIDRRSNMLLNTDQYKFSGELWLGLNFIGSAVPDFFDHLISHSENCHTIPPESSVDWFISLLCQGGAMVWQTYQFANLFKDPTSRLPGRIEFQACLKKTIHDAMLTKSTVGVILLNPDEFATINQRLSQEQGDLVLAEIAERLLSFLRSYDLVYRYGGAMFALILAKTDKVNIEILTEKIRTSLSGSYLKASARLSFSVGAAIHQADSKDNSRENVLNLVKQADQALNLAKLSGGDKCVIWDKDKADSSLLSFDRLGNIFTSESEKDYRNMLLLWDTIHVISTGSDAQKIATEFVERVKLTLKPFRIGLFEENKDASLHKLATRYGQEVTVSEWQLSKNQKQLLDAVKQGKRTERIRFTEKTNMQQKEVEIQAYGFPLLIREQLIGYLYIDGPENTFVLDSSDIAFLNALTRQLALSLDRAALVLRWKHEKEKESRLLKEEVRELRQVIHSAKLIYRSPQMQSLLDTLSSVAPTDVTVLITGESGTGKQMLARAIHEQSLRKNKPFITVDCGAITHTLIEAELFGHVKGAYTGALSASPGRILQAENGTLFLDEIGELPLDVQAKLLRFVQEKEINPVGGHKTKQVNVRIVAATNRDLADEVATGRFRSDLYYRLQVITLSAPSLRDRPDDIMPLARHFLEKFSLQYAKGMLNLSDEAEKALLEYQWPGNIRELQNTIMRAVVISKNERIDLEVLNLKTSSVSQSREFSQYQNSTALAEQQPYKPGEVETSGNIWEQLQKSISAKVQSVLDAEQIIAVPLGKWLTEDLVLETDRFEKGIARRGSLRLGLPETTFRRQLDKLKQAEQAGVLSRTDDWQDIQPLLFTLVSSLDEISTQNIIEQVRLIMLQEIINRIPKDKSLGSSLMGVTFPTYQRWLEKLPPG